MMEVGKSTPTIGRGRILTHNGIKGKKVKHLPHFFLLTSNNYLNLTLQTPVMINQDGNISLAGDIQEGEKQFHHHVVAEEENGNHKQFGERWKLPVRTCRVCCLICDSGDDEADVPDNIGDAGADQTLDLCSSLDGDPAPGEAIGFSRSSGPRARCSDGDVSLPASSLLGSARISEIEGDSSPSIAARPDSEADGDP
ncbi:hypothetical protein EJB05_08043, partial [Eragrostis curvula]